MNSKYDQSQPTQSASATQSVPTALALSSSSFYPHPGSNCLALATYSISVDDALSVQLEHSS